MMLTRAKFGKVETFEVMSQFRSEPFISKTDWTTKAQDTSPNGCMDLFWIYVGSILDLLDDLHSNVEEDTGAQPRAAAAAFSC